MLKIAEMLHNLQRSFTDFSNPLSGINHLWEQARTGLAALQRKGVPNGPSVHRSRKPIYSRDHTLGLRCGDKITDFDGV